jgi:glutathione S-transferase
MLSMRTLAASDLDSSPFSQRVWIALEVKEMQYQYCETDPYKRPTQLLEANPRGTVPAIREGDWASGESSVILEYVGTPNLGTVFWNGN